MRQLVNTVVPRSLAALHQHQENLTRHLAEHEWDRVNTEQINAARTAQVRAGELGEGCEGRGMGGV